MGYSPPDEVDYSYYNFEKADIKMLFTLFEMYEKEETLSKGLVQPAYDYAKCSTFNLLDARGALSVSERTAYIGRVRHLARLCAKAYLDQREQLGYPLLKDEALREQLLNSSQKKAADTASREVK